MNGDQLRVRFIIELDSISGVSSNLVSAKCFSSGNIPDNECVVILTTERCEVLFIVGEGKALDENLVELKTLNYLKGIKIPDNDISLEAHVSLLSTGDVLSGA